MRTCVSFNAKYFELQTVPAKHASYIIIFVGRPESKERFGGT